MNTKKLVAALLAILIVGISSPALIPRGHADDTSMSLTTTGYALRNSYDPFLQRTVDAVKAGSTLQFTLVFVASGQNFQRNVSMGVKFDWMNTYQNSSMANPASTYTIFANQIAYITLNVTIPALTGQYSGLNLITHNWQVQVWNGPANSAWSNGCGFDEFFAPYLACRNFFNNNPLAIYSSTQASGILARQQATTEIAAIRASQGVYCFSGATCISQPTAGTASAQAFLAQASTQLSLGDTAYSTGDFNGANNDYQNAVNDANSAQNSLGTVGGGTDTATLSSIWIQAVAILFGGIGALLVGFAGFKYLRGRAKAFTSYSPASSPKP